MIILAEEGASIKYLNFTHFPLFLRTLFGSHVNLLNNDTIICYSIANMHQKLPLKHIHSLNPTIILHCVFSLRARMYLIWSGQQLVNLVGRCYVVIRLDVHIKEGDVDGKWFLVKSKWLREKNLVVCEIISVLVQPGCRHGGCLCIVWQHLLSSVWCQRFGMKLFV